jgi:hypothetical protein
VVASPRRDGDRQNGVTVGGTVAEHQILTSTPASWTVTFPSSSTNVVLQPQPGRQPPAGWVRDGLDRDGGEADVPERDVLPRLAQHRALRAADLDGLGPFVIYVRTALTAKGPFIVPNGSTGPARFVLGFAGTSDVFLQASSTGP